MSISIVKHGDEITARVDDQLTTGNRDELRQAVLDELDRGGRKFLVDFRHTGYIDSGGLGVLVSISRRIRERGGQVRLANLNDDLRTLFELTKLHTFFDIGGEDDGQVGEPAPRQPRSPGPLARAAEEQRPEPGPTP